MPATREEALAAAEARLLEVQAAISQVLSAGQADSVNDREKVRAQLEQLNGMEEKLEGKIARLSRGAAMQAYQVVPK